MAEKLRIEFEGDMRDLRAELRKVLGEAEGTGKKGGKRFGSSFSQGFKDAFAGFTVASLTTRGIDAVTVAINKGIEDMLAKETALADFSAITGVAGFELQKFGEAAEELSNKFGTSTVENIESFKGVLSRLGPDFASSAAAVKLMGDNINTLAVASGLTATESMDALTTAMLQFGVDLSDPNKAAEEATRLMNEMAAGAKEGAAEVPQIAAALKQVGSTASSLGVSSLEVGAFIQTLAMGGKTGSEAGVALRNVLTSMIRETGPATEALDSMGLSSAQLGEILTSGPGGANNALKTLKAGLSELSGPAERNATLVKIFGVENLAAAQTLISLTDATDDLTTAMEGTNTAVEQSAINMDTTEAKWRRFTTFLENSLVTTLEKGKSVLSELFSSIESLGNIGEDGFFASISKSGLSMMRGLGDVLDYSTLGIIKTNEWLGLNEQQRQAAEAAAKAQAAAEKEKAEAAKKAADEKEKLFGKEQNLEKQRSKRRGSGTTSKKETPLSGTIGALELEIAELEKTMRNKLDPASQAWDDMRRRVVMLKAELRDLNSGLGDTFKIIELGANDMRPIGGPDAPLVDVPAVRDQSDKMLTTNQLLQSGFQATSISIGMIGETIATAFTGGEDALKSILKAIGNQIITFVEGAILAAEGFSLAEGILSAGATLIKDAPLLAGALIALEAGRGILNSLDVGGYLREDQMIRAHADETVIPLRQVPSIWAETIDRAGGGARTTTRAPYHVPTAAEMRGSVSVSYDNLSRGSRNARIKQQRRVG